MSGPVLDGEAEVIIWTTFDLDEGADYGYVRYVRRPSGEPVFEEPEMVVIDIQAAEKSPGRMLVQAFLGDCS